MAAKKNNAGKGQKTTKANSSKKSEKNITPGSATKGAVKSAAKQAKNAGKTKGVIKNAQMTVEDVDAFFI